MCSLKCATKCVSSCACICEIVCVCVGLCLIYLPLPYDNVHLSFTVLFQVVSQSVSVMMMWCLLNIPTVRHNWKSKTLQLTQFQNCIFGSGNLEIEIVAQTVCHHLHLCLNEGLSRQCRSSLTRSFPFQRRPKNVAKKSCIFFPHCPTSAVSCLMKQPSDPC